MERQAVNEVEVCPGKHKFLIKQSRSSWSKKVTLKATAKMHSTHKFPGCSKRSFL